jgi:CheY-like chemotaxis protein
MKSSSESPTHPITVVIADDHPVVREGLVSIFKSQRDIKVVAEVTNGEDTLEICNQHLPDVLLLDPRMPRKDGLQVMTELAARTASEPGAMVRTTYSPTCDFYAARFAELLIPLLPTGASRTEARQHSSISTRNPISYPRQHDA